MADETPVTAEAREQGVETVDCPNCGKTLKMHELSDGAVSYGPCTSCFSKPTKTEVKEQAEAQLAGVFPSRETGTDTNEE